MWRLAAPNPAKPMLPARMLVLAGIFLATLGSPPQDSAPTSTETPPGHLQRLGSHRPPLGHVEETHEFPAPADFFANFVQRSRPLLVRGGARHMPLHQQSDAELAAAFGAETLTFEVGKREDRNSPGGNIRMDDFLRTYRQRDRYAVSDLPYAMMGQILLPPSLACGGIRQALAKVVMWFSSGGTESVIHTDHFENFNCLMDGKKRLIMIDRKHVDVLEAADMPWRVDGSFLAVDPLKVNMYVAGPLAKLDYYVADMQAGDCLYIPKVWYHQVSSAPGRNLAVNIWWLNEGQSFNSSDCEGVDITARRTLAGEAFLQHEPSIPVLLGDCFEDEPIARNDPCLSAMTLPDDDWDKVGLEEGSVFALLDADGDGRLSFQEINKLASRPNPPFLTDTGRHLLTHFRPKWPTLEPGQQLLLANGDVPSEVAEEVFGGHGPHFYTEEEYERLVERMHVPIYWMEESAPAADGTGSTPPHEEL